MGIEQRTKEKGQRHTDSAEQWWEPRPGRRHPRRRKQLRRLSLLVVVDRLRVHFVRMHRTSLRGKSHLMRHDRAARRDTVALLEGQRPIAGFAEVQTAAEACHTASVS